MRHKRKTTTMLNLKIVAQITTGNQPQLTVTLGNEMVTNPLLKAIHFGMDSIWYFGGTHAPFFSFPVASNSS